MSVPWCPSCVGWCEFSALRNVFVTVFPPRTPHPLGQLKTRNVSDEPSLSMRRKQQRRNASASWQ